MYCCSIYFPGCAVVLYYPGVPKIMFLMLMIHTMNIICSLDNSRYSRYWARCIFTMKHFLLAFIHMIINVIFHWLLIFCIQSFSHLHQNNRQCSRNPEILPIFTITECVPCIFLDSNTSFLISSISSISSNLLFVAIACDGDYGDGGGDDDGEKMVLYIV